MQTTLEINDALLAQAYVLAEREHITLNRLIEDALAQRLHMSPSRRRTALPVYHGQGGLTAAISDSLTHRALLDAADEIETP